MKKSREHVGLAGELRQKQTDAEKALWARLRNRQVEGVKFRRRQPIASNVVDFVSFKRKLMIEINGGQHDEDKLSPSPSLSLQGRGISYTVAEKTTTLEGLAISLAAQLIFVVAGFIPA